MIKYTTKDIIKRAEQLADLENSDFISDYEKSSLMNESWTELYQKIVNANDKSFIKTVYASNGMTLPSDFYQLSGLYIEQSKDQINKINASQRDGYEIKNNKLVLSSYYDDVSVVMEYYPVPRTLFYSAGKRESVSYSYNPKVIIDSDFYVDTDNEIVDSSLGVISTATPAGLQFANGFIHVESETVEEVTTYKTVFTDWNGNEIETRQNKPFVLKGNQITFDEVTGEDISDFILFVTDETENQAYFIDRDFKVYNKGKEDTEIVLTSSSLLFCRQDGLYFTVNGSNKITRLLGKVSEIFSLGLVSFCAFYDERNCIVSYNGNYYRMSYGFNTLLEYPNNTYFVLLSYMLAISFKLKQQGDITALSAKTEEITNQFMDSLSRDANGFYTMKDVYKNGNKGLW